ncbi:hypothetical protein LO762_20150 [Actinocorallia sp. API 0066]|uniref:hypothetical protein n=1 Tax=Actinocorallia sp. API 0066 TaxID=2896846 RepID=UPI001E4AEC1A|nr:hypothetical protein [Actinocorallia sp. API 0066]MCD0451490.1 hypothetical protein [Actinocorallia sp. API 0066]
MSTDGNNLFRVVPGPPKLALPGLLPVYELYVRAGAELLEQPGPLEAELWLSAQLGELSQAAPDREALGKAQSDLIKVLRRAGTPGARAFLAVFAAVGPHEHRAAAAKAVGELRGPLLPPLPSWADDAGKAIAVDACSIQDGTLDRLQYVVEYRYPDGSGHHGLSVSLSAGLPVQIVVIGDMMGMRSELRKVLEEGEVVVSALPLPIAAGILRPAFGELATVPHAELTGPFHANLLFAEHRLSLLS